MPTRDFLRTETLRLAALQSGDLFNTPLESRFNRLARIVRRALRVQASAITVFEGDREWTKAADGCEWPELLQTPSLAAVLARQGSAVVISDTHEHASCRDHVVVREFPKIRYCAVYPLRARSNEIVGAVAVYDTTPRRETRDTLEILEDICQLAQRELFISDAAGAQEILLRKLSSARRESVIDELTRVWNRRGGTQLLDQSISDCREQNQGMGVCIADLDRFKDLNDRHGHLVGDALLKKVAAILVDSVRASDIICRLGGEEFLLVIPNIGAQDLSDIMERIRQRVAEIPLRSRVGTTRLTISIGGCLHAPDDPATADDLLRRADDALYRAKGSGRDAVVLMPVAAG